MTTQLPNRYLVETGHDDEHYLRTFDMRSLKEWLTKDIETARYSGDDPSLVRLSQYVPKPPGSGNAQLAELRLFCRNPDAAVGDNDYFRYEYEIQSPGRTDLGDDEWLVEDVFSVRIDGRA